MRFRTVSTLLLILGALVGGLAGLAMALGLRLDQLPPWMITVGMYKLAFIAAAGLFIAGAVLGRAARRSPTRPMETNDEDRIEPQLGSAPWESTSHARRSAERADRPPQER